MGNLIIEVIAAALVICIVCNNPAKATHSHGEASHGGGWGQNEVKEHGNGWDHQAKGKGWESNYKYGYSVNDEHTGDVKSAYETRHEGWTKGSYAVLQPDGILRTVTYVADPWNGFKAVVHNQGWAKAKPSPKSHGWGEEKGHEKKTEGWSSSH